MIGKCHNGEFHFENQSKMCHCHDNLALLPEVAKILKEKMKREYIQIRCSIYEKKLLKKKSGQGWNFPFRIPAGYRF